MYEVKEMEIWGANVLTLQLRMGNVRFFIMGCYIPPSNLKTLTDIDRAWQACPSGVHPLLVGDLNFNFHALCTECKEMIAKQADARDLVDMFRIFCQCLENQLRGRWTWRIRREGRWISSQCDYFFGRDTDHRSSHAGRCHLCWRERRIEAVLITGTSIPHLPSPQSMEAAQH